MPYAILCDIDGVLCRGDRAIPGAARFVAELQRSGRKFLFLTNSPDRSPAENSARVKRLTGETVPEDRFYTSSEALAGFVSCQKKGARVYAVGSRALRAALKAEGARLVDRKADFVIFCGGGRFGPEELDKAVELVQGGASLLTANREPNSLTPRGIGPGCGAVVAAVERATNREAYAVGKPNHLMIRAAEKLLEVEAGKAIMIGDSLRTDVDVGLQAQMKTALVLSGITSKDDLERSPIRPHYVFPSVAAIRLGRLP